MELEEAAMAYCDYKLLITGIVIGICIILVRVWLQIQMIHQITMK